MSSKIFSFGRKVLLGLNRWYEASSVAKVFNKVWDTLGQAFRGSFIHNFFLPGKREAIWDNSIFGKVLNLPQKFILFLQRKLSVKINNFINNSMICRAVLSWANVSVRLYGVFFLMFGIVLCITRYNHLLTLATSAFSTMSNF